jgi:hypothetical protein
MEDLGLELVADEAVARWAEMARSVERDVLEPKAPASKTGGQIEQRDAVGVQLGREPLGERRLHAIREAAGKQHDEEPDAALAAAHAHAPHQGQVQPQRMVLVTKRLLVALPPVPSRGRPLLRQERRQPVV